MKPIRVFWSKEEDAMLKMQVRIHGIPKWKAVSKAFINKTASQCRNRWLNYLCSEVKTIDWTPDEDKLLLESQQTLGNKWVKVRN